MWAVCLELQEFGGDPARIKEFIRKAPIGLLINWLMSDDNTDNRKYWAFYPNFLTEWYDGILWNAKGTFVEDLSEITEKSDPISESLKSRMAVINVARLRDAVRKALEA
jgi:hypothetical protein